MVSKAKRSTVRQRMNIERCLMYLSQNNRSYVVHQFTGMNGQQINHYMSHGIATDTQLGFLHALFGDVRTIERLEDKLRSDRCNYCWDMKRETTDPICNKCQRLKVHIYVSRSIGKSTSPPIHVILMQKIHALVERGRRFGSVSHGGWSATFEFKLKE